MGVARIIRCTVAGEVIVLRPSLRNALNLEQRPGSFSGAVSKIMEGSLETASAILKDNAPAISIDDIFDALPSLKEPMLQYVAACAGLDATERTSGGGKGNSVPFKDYLESLYRIGTGWLGWPPGVTLDATPAEITEAYKGRIEFMRAIFGSSEPEAPTTSNLGEKFKAVFSGMGTKIMQRPIRKARKAA